LQFLIPSKLHFKLHRKYGALIKGVGYEEYGLQADIEHIQYIMEQENYRFNITKLGGSVAKEDRIKGLIPIFEQKRYWMPRKLIYVTCEGIAKDYIKDFISDEYDTFPVSTHYDMFDCKARIIAPKLDAKFPKIKPKTQGTNNHGGAGSWMG